MLMGMLTVAWGRESFSRVVLMMNLTDKGSVNYQHQPLRCDIIPMFPENKGCWYVDLPLGSIVSH